MSINQEGLDAQVKSGSVSIFVPLGHPLLQIAAKLPWREIADLALTDLKKTARGFWWMDLDSTVQEGNMAYPSDANMMLKLARSAGRIIDWLRNKGTTTLSEEFSVDLAGIAKTSKEYFFLAKNTVIEKRREVFRRLHRQVKKSVYPLIDFLQSSGQSSLDLLPWNLREQARMIGKDAKRYLLDVAHFVRKHALKPGKILSLHLREVACACKGKLGKDCEFGRVFQLGRIGGNFLIPMACTSVRMEDKLNFGSAIIEHAAIFGDGRLDSIATDKGYYSKANFNIAANAGVREIGLQCPGRVKIRQSSENIVDAKRLRDRRAGIEPLISHAKRFGLGKSRMKSDISTLASGYRSVLGFNFGFQFTSNRKAFFRSDEKSGMRRGDFTEILLVKRETLASLRS